MEWLIKLSKPMDLIGILQITSAAFKCAAAGTLGNSWGWGGGRLLPFPSYREDKVCNSTDLVGEVGSSPWALIPFLASVWRARPLSSGQQSVFKIVGPAQKGRST